MFVREVEEENGDGKVKFIKTTEMNLRCKGKQLLGFTKLDQIQNCRIIPKMQSQSLKHVPGFKMSFSSKNYHDEEKKTQPSSPAGNRTPVSRVPGGKTHHYTTEDFR